MNYKIKITKKPRPLSRDVHGGRDPHDGGGTWDECWPDPDYGWRDPGDGS